MEFCKLEKEMYHDGILLMHYALCYPIGEDFTFAKEMTEGYAAYLEGAYFEKAVKEYNQNPDRRKRFHHTVCEVRQSCKAYRDERMASVCFYVCENRQSYAFAFTFDKEKRYIMTLRDFAVKRRRGEKKRLYFDGAVLHVFSKSGELVEKIDFSSEYRKV